MFDQFAKRILCLFIQGFVLVIGLEVLAEALIISKITESTVRAAVWSILAAYFVHQTHSTFRFNSAFLAASLFAIFSSLGFGLGILEDIRAFDSVPLLGWSGAYHGLPQKMCFCIWSCSLAWLFLVLTRRVEREHLQLTEQRAKLAHDARVVALGEMVGGIAHELTQPMAAATNFIAAAKLLLARGADSQEQAINLLTKSEVQTQRASHIIRQLRDLTSPSPEVRREVSVNDIVTDALGLMDADVRRHNVSVETRLSLENPKIVVDEVQIQQVLINLIRNALDAMADQSPSHRQLTVSTMQLEREQTAILVADSGPGISSDDVGRLFDAFFSTKPDGMGIGLSISRTIVEAHGGTIGVNSTEDAPVGASFQVTLPAAKASRPEPHFRRSIETSRTKLSTEDL